jgi:hypothetical protein
MRGNVCTSGSVPLVALGAIQAAQLYPQDCSGSIASHPFAKNAKECGTLSMDDPDKHHKNWATRYCRR